MSVFDDGESTDNTTPHQANQPNQHTPKTYEDYQQLRKAAPSKYYSATMQQRMYSDAQALGKAAFFTKSKATKKWWE